VAGDDDERLSALPLLRKRPTAPHNGRRMRRLPPFLLATLLLLLRMPHRTKAWTATMRGDSHMFLNTRRPQPKLLSSAASTTYRWRTLPDRQMPTNNVVGKPDDRQRGSLGFWVATTQTALSATRNTKVDSSAWNGAARWNVEDNDRSSEGSSDPPPRAQRLLWSTFSPPYAVLDRLQQEGPADALKIDDWQKELMENDVSWADSADTPVQKNPRETAARRPTKDRSSSKEAAPAEKKTTVNSLAEWARTVDLEPLLQRREEIHREKWTGKPSQRPDASRSSNKEDPPQPLFRSREDLVTSLTKLFDKSSASKYSNLQVQQMYAAAKLADQQGQRGVAREILTQLLEATPQDARLYRRLARMEKEEGRISQAREILQRGLRVHPKNAYLWQGLGQLAATETEAKKFYRRAIRSDPTMPNAYHALGTLEHSQGYIAKAMQTLKKGIEYCPTNHRLHHATGDLYRDAKMLDMAEKAYHKALRYGPDVSRGFCYTALAYVAYENGQVDAARAWLQKGTQLNQGRQANAWLALAQMEEAEGRVEAARQTCAMALNRYEKGLLIRHKRRQQGKQSTSQATANVRGSCDAVSVKNSLLENVPVYRSGDRFFNVYRTWVRLEEQYGTLESAEAVYERAAAAFPQNFKIALDWADLYAKLKLPHRARQIFVMATARAGSFHGDPYRRFAEYEMSRHDYETARKILFRGALRLSESGQGRGLAELYHTWAVCEWHLGDLGRAEVLLDHALRLTPAGAEGSAMRSTFLYTLASLQHYRGEHLLAQHCLALCLKENVGSTAKLWDLWAEAARALGKDDLESQCLAQAEQAREPHDARLLPAKPEDLKDMMRRDPWHYKLFPKASTQVDDSPFAYCVQLPTHQTSLQEQW
jgi:tetratricopeptide (TPR) repeat protein